MANAPTSLLTIPETVRRAFEDRTVLSLTETAALLEMDPKTLRNHISDGDIACRTKGRGVVRRTWVFTINDVLAFLGRPSSPGQPRVHDNRRHPAPNAGQIDRMRETLRRSGSTMNIALRKRKSKPKSP